MKETHLFVKITRRHLDEKHCSGGCCLASPDAPDKTCFHHKRENFAAKFSSQNLINQRISGYHVFHPPAFPNKNKVT